MGELGRISQVCSEIVRMCARNTGLRPFALEGLEELRKRMAEISVAASPVSTQQQPSSLVKASPSAAAAKRTTMGSTPTRTRSSSRTAPIAQAPAEEQRRPSQETTAAAAAVAYRPSVAPVYYPDGEDAPTPEPQSAAAAPQQQMQTQTMQPIAREPEPKPQTQPQQALSMSGSFGKSLTNVSPVTYSSIAFAGGGVTAAPATTASLDSTCHARFSYNRASPEEQEALQKKFEAQRILRAELQAQMEEHKRAGTGRSGSRGRP